MALFAALHCALLTLPLLLLIVSKAALLGTLGVFRWYVSSSLESELVSFFFMPIMTDGGPNSFLGEAAARCSWILFR